MDASALLASLRASGVELAAEDDRLRYRPRDRVSPGLLDALARHKPEILDLLAAEADALGNDDDHSPAAGLPWPADPAAQVAQEAEAGPSDAPGATRTDVPGPCVAS